MTRPITIQHENGQRTASHTRNTQLPLTPPTKPSQHARRNDGAISLVLAEVRRKLTEAVETADFHGKIEIVVDVVNQELTMAEVTPRQRIKLK